MRKIKGFQYFATSWRFWIFKKIIDEIDKKG